MILLKLSDKEKPVLLEALHFFGSELEERLKSSSDGDSSGYLRKMEALDQIIRVIQLTNQKPVC
mgnify:FL=1